MRFDSVVFMGTGHVLAACAETLLALGVGAEKVCLAEYGANAASISHVQKYSEKTGVAYLGLPKQNAGAERFFMDLAGEVLVVSVNNLYLFPACVRNKAGLTLVNSHSSLLPAYPGLHAPSWAIFFGETVGGVTWHFIGAGVNSGNIIHQKFMEIPENITAIQLDRAYADLKAQAFGELLPALLREKQDGTPQPEEQRRRVYTMADLPNAGHISPLDNVLFSHRVLRSMDCGDTAQLPPVWLDYAGRRYTVRAYRLEAAPGLKGAKAACALVAFDAEKLHFTIGQNGLALHLDVREKEV